MLNFAIVKRVRSAVLNRPPAITGSGVAMPRFASIVPAALIAGFALVLGSGPGLAQDKVGVNSAVNPEASGTPPGGTARRLVIGQDVVYNEHITTGPAGQTQLLFLDESSMSVGPNSDLTIDQFVYDPKTGSGKLAMSATRGLLRYVGGRLSKQDEAVTLKTSTATLAVRGGAFIVNITPNGTTNAVFVYGNGLTVTSNSGGTQTVTRPGFGTTVTPGNAPTQPAQQPPGQLTEYLAQLDGRSGGNGGASTIPSDQTVASSGVQNTISGNVDNSVQQATQNTQGTGSSVGTSNTGNGSPSGTAGTNLQNAANNASACQSGSTCSSSSGTQAFTASGTSTSNSGTGTGNGSGNTPPTPSAVTFAGRLKYTNGNGTARGFVDQTSNGDFPYASGTLSFPNGAAQPGVFTGTFNAAVGTLSFPLASGSATFQGTSSVLGQITGTSFLSADGTYFYANITPTANSTERLFVSGGLPAGVPTANNAGVFAATGSTRVFSFTVQPDAALQSNIPFVRGQAGGNLPNANVSPLYAVAPANTNIGNASTTSAARGLQASLAINGQGANQQSVIAVTTGTFGTNASGQPQFAGVMRGSSMLSASGTPTRLSSAVSSTPDANGNSFYGTTNGITGFTLDQTQYATSSTPGTLGAAVVPSTATEVPLTSTAATTYGFAQPAVATSNATGLGANRSTQAMTGNFGGLMYTTAQSTPYAITGGALIATDAATNRVQGTLAGTAQTASSGVNNVQMQFGGLTGSDQGRAAFVDNSHFAALESTTNPQQINGQNLVVNGSTAQASQLYMVSSGAAGQAAQLLPAGASNCQCQYLQWGYWGGDLNTGNSSNSTVSRVDRGNINTWVVGTPTPSADLNNLISQSATATYTGTAIGSVFNNGASYVAAGGFNGTYNFGTQNATVAVTNFDGRNFAAAGRAPLSGPNYSLAVSSPGVAGNVNGTFYGPAAAETGGSFAVHTTAGPTYIASGIFTGKR
jgi:hypothetical protein